MRHNKQTKFVMYVDDFLEEDTLKSLQKTFEGLKVVPKKRCF